MYQTDWSLKFNGLEVENGWSFEEKYLLGLMASNNENFILKLDGAMTMSP